MTLQTFSRAPLAPAREAHSASFWRRLFDAIMEGWQRKADAYVADYLARHSGDYHDQQRAAFERRREPLAQVRTGERAGEAPRRQAMARSVQSQRDARNVDKPAIERDACPPYDHRALVVAASAWLAFYIIATIHELIAPGY